MLTGVYEKPTFSDMDDYYGAVLSLVVVCILQTYIRGYKKKQEVGIRGYKNNYILKK